MFNQQFVADSQLYSNNSPSSRPLQSIPPTQGYGYNFNKKPYNFHTNDPSRSLLLANNPQERQQQAPEQASFARNFKARLFNADPQIQKQKQKKQQSYRGQLERQMKELQQKKRKQKEKIQAEDLKFEQDFMKQQQIYAQRDNKQKKDDKNYFVVRSAQKNRKKGQVQSAPKAAVDNFLQNEQSAKPKISKKAYHNRKNYSLQQSQVSPQHHINGDLEKQLMRQRNYEEERIAKIIAFQQDMMKKLDNMRSEIKNTGSHLNVAKQLEGVRLKIRARPLVLAGVDLQTRSYDFYDLPVRKKPQILPHQLTNMNQSLDVRKRYGNSKHSIENSRVNGAASGGRNEHQNQEDRRINQASRESQDQDEEARDQVYLPAIKNKNRGRETTPKVDQNRTDNRQYQQYGSHDLEQSQQR